MTVSSMICTTFHDFLLGGLKLALGNAPLRKSPALLNSGLELANGHVNDLLHRVIALRVLQYDLHAFQNLSLTPDVFKLALCKSSLAGCPVHLHSFLKLENGRVHDLLLRAILDKTLRYNFQDFLLDLRHKDHNIQNLVGGDGSRFAPPCEARASMSFMTWWTVTSTISS